jgi:hypothetical protein
MKKFNSMLAFAAIAGAMFFTSCEDDATDPVKPSISIESPTDGSTVTVGSPVILKATLSANEKLKSATLTIKNGSDEFSGDTTFSGSVTSFEINDTLSFANAGTAVITISVTDKKDVTETKIITLNVSTGVSESVNDTIYNVAAPTGFLGAYDLVLDKALASSASEATKDLKDLGLATSSTTWNQQWGAGNGNGTTFVKANSFDYANATAASMAAAFRFVTSSNAGGVYAIKITNVVATSSDNKDYVVFSYKK